MLPGSVVAMVAIIAVVQFARSMVSQQQDLLVQLWFAFIPARYADTFFPFPGGLGADAWTFVTYALLHGSWVHLLTNTVWLVAFGSAVARRFGPLRFWLFSAAAAAGGAALHLALHFGDPIPVVGASAAIAGQMAAAARFVFDSHGPLVLRRGGDDSAFRRPATSLVDTFRNRSALLFIVIWFGINLAVGIGSSVSGGVAIAWEAHIGGFLVGLLLFRFFDPVPPR
ncbi:rhomboid family intramembrane serine protease [Acuticoccus sediminis]|uniref:Rhomboid family intramembrane serine protease n=2 Tax=Acuticoccus sediminis TaxID=2184697 RepID=A0A8B2NS49_9HYPH|nr:rhomboid family intramembrane serine protease [Acuticoccus sediminis]